MVKKFKDVVKQNPEPARGKSGTDPMDPWNAKSGIAEASEQELLHRYLKSRGINPDYIPKDTKIAHSKSAAFLSWRQAHEFDESVEILEATDPKDMVCMDIPLLIRVLEFTREEMSSDIELHNMVERLINMRHEVPLDMTHYDEITKKLVKEEVIEEGRMKDIATDAAETKRLNKMTTLQKFRADAGAREKKHDEIQKNVSKDGSGMSSAIDRLEKHMNKEEVEQIDELKKSTVKSWLKQQPVVPEKKPGMDKKAHNQRIKTRSKSWDSALDRITGRKPTSENTLDSMAATEAPCSCDNSDEPYSPSKERSKSARIIKALYKKKGIKEETYDWEKDDKSTQVYGKKPKLKDTPEDDNVGENKPEARAVLSGGKTMTGEKRDDVEIDPFMKKPKNNTPDDFEKPIGRKDK